LVKPSRIRGVLAVSTAVVLHGSAATPGPAPPQVPAAPPGTVVVHGRPGTFGAAGGAVPSGQSLATHPVPGIAFPPGLQAGRLLVTGDGTVLTAATSQRFDLRDVSAEQAAVLVYPPERHRAGTVPIRTTTGQERMLDAAGLPAAPSVADLETLAGGAGVLFTAHPTYRDRRGADGGRWPVLGVLSAASTAGGRWSVAARWTAEDVCPGAADGVECGGLDQLARLPRSGDLIVTRGGGLLALRVTGPDPAGRFAVAVTGRYGYPQIRDPGRPGLLDVEPWQVQADPTGVPGDERVVVTLRFRGRTAREMPTVLQEFSYDAAAGTIRPVSAPFGPGDRDPVTRAVYGYGATLFDRAGNLWAARLDGLRGGSLAVYAVRDGRRRPGGATCPFDPGRHLDSYVFDAGEGRMWGQPCPPDYDLLQGRALLGMQGLVEDPGTGDVAGLAFGGTVLPVRPAGAGAAMTFRIGNLVDVGRKLLPDVEGYWSDHRTGGVDRAHRFWFSATQGHPDRVGVPADQWLYAVDLGDLFAPPAVRLPGTPGATVVLQAEQTVTAGTTRRAGPGGTVLVRSDAHFVACADWPASVGCGYDAVPGNGFALADDTGYGHLRGAVDFRVHVERAGRFRVAFRATALPATTAARIEMHAGGRTYVTAVPGGPWGTVTAPEPVELPAGEQIIRLSVPGGGGGWYLNALTLQRA
jgi:hypothetical protein